MLLSAEMPFLSGKFSELFYWRIFRIRHVISFESLHFFPEKVKPLTKFGNITSGGPCIVSTLAARRAIVMSESFTDIQF